MQSASVDTPLSYYESSVNGREAFLLTALLKLAIALGRERSLPAEQIGIMADDLAQLWSFSLEEIAYVLLDWRQGSLTDISERELLRFPCTVQILGCLRRRRASARYGYIRSSTAVN